MTYLYSSFMKIVKLKRHIFKSVFSVQKEQKYDSKEQKQWRKNYKTS